jgi:hypothetical protein
MKGSEKVKKLFQRAGLLTLGVAVFFGSFGSLEKYVTHKGNEIQYILTIILFVAGCVLLILSEERG